MGTALADPSDVVDMWRPLTSAERDRVARLILKASSLLRQRMPSVDARIAAFLADPTDPQGLDEQSVATVVATIVKRFVSNTEGAASVTQSLGSASLTKSYAQRGVADKLGDARGQLVVLDADLASLNASTPRRPFFGTATVSPRLAPPVRSCEPPWV